MAKNRHLSRVVCMQSLYEWQFRGSRIDLSEIVNRNIREFEKDVDASYIKTVTTGVKNSLEDINQLITKAAPDWPLEQIAKVDRNILLVAIFEMLFDTTKDVPPRVSINEAIEIAKTYGSESSSKFVNGVLGYVYRAHEEDLKPRDERK